MNYEDKKDKVREIATRLLAQSQAEMLAKVEKAINSGAVDIDGWDEGCNPMILPKSIVSAVLQYESGQYDCAGTSFEKEVKRNVKNLRHFL